MTLMTRSSMSMASGSSLRAKPSSVRNRQRAMRNLVVEPRRLGRKVEPALLQR